MKIDHTLVIIIHVFAISLGACVDTIYVAGFTSGKKHAASDDRPFLCITLTNGETREKVLPNLKPVNDMTRNKGDLWKISIESFGFSKACVTKKLIRQVMLRAQPRPKGNDGWNIASVMTVIDISGAYSLLTADFQVNRWIDANSDESRQIFYLTKV